MMILRKVSHAGRWSSESRESKFQEHDDYSYEARTATGWLRDKPGCTDQGITLRDFIRSGQEKKLQLVAFTELY